MLVEFFSFLVAIFYAHYHVFLWLLIGGGAAYAVTCHYIPIAARHLFDSHLFGIDINKTVAPERKVLRDQVAGKRYSDLTPHEQSKIIPESLGIVVGGVYLIHVILLALVLQIDLRELSGPITTITVMLLLGFVDDVLSIPWRYKIALSAIGALPLILVYDDSTSMMIPRPLDPLLMWLGLGVSNTSSSSSASASFAFTLPMDIHCLSERSSAAADSGESLRCLFNFGALYLVYLVLLCVFCTNSINILAGINGVEVGQSLVIAVASAAYVVYQCRFNKEVLELQELASATAGSVSSRSHEWWWQPTPIRRMDSFTAHRLHALTLLVPFIGVSCALWKYNRYPSRVFVGDSYTYFAGTVLSVAAISGLYSKTLLLFFIPQLLNFFISLPQLTGFVYCPPHRVPRWNAETNLLEDSGNYTILNVILRLLVGSRSGMNENRLTNVFLVFHIATCLLGMGVIRFGMASWLYDRVE